MKEYKVTAKQVYYVYANSPEEAKIHFINKNDYVGIGFTEVTDVEFIGMVAYNINNEKEDK